MTLPNLAPPRPPLPPRFLHPRACPPSERARRSGNERARDTAARGAALNALWRDSFSTQHNRRERTGRGVGAGSWPRPGCRGAQREAAPSGAGGPRALSRCARGCTHQQREQRRAHIRATIRRPPLSQDSRRRLRIATPPRFPPPPRVPSSPSSRAFPSLFLRKCPQTAPSGPRRGSRRRFARQPSGREHVRPRHGRARRQPRGGGSGYGRTAGSAGEDAVRL